VSGVRYYTCSIWEQLAQTHTCGCSGSGSASSKHCIVLHSAFPVGEVLPLAQLGVCGAWRVCSLGCCMTLSKMFTGS
jgi:hypothetical protein